MTSDINYYTACRLMLSRSNTGLLHDVPRHVDRRYALGKLIEECTKPQTLRDRFVVKDNLLSVLGKLARVNETPSLSNSIKTPQSAGKLQARGID